MNCSIFETYGSISKLRSYGLDSNPTLKKTERQKALQLLEDLYSCADAECLVCGESLGRLNCSTPVITSTPNNLTIVSFTNGVLTRVDPQHLRYSAVVTLSFLNPLILPYFSASLGTHGLNQNDMPVVISGAVSNFSRIGTSNSWNIQVLFTSLVPLTTETYQATGTITITDTLTPRTVNFDSGNIIL